MRLPSTVLDMFPGRMMGVIMCVHMYISCIYSLLYFISSLPLPSCRRVEWKETARWVKFEEDVEEGGNKWSKPHVATLSLHSLFELRSCIIKGTVLLDLEGTDLGQIAGEEHEMYVMYSEISDTKMCP